MSRLTSNWETTSSTWCSIGTTMSLWPDKSKARRTPVDLCRQPTRWSVIWQRAWSRWERQSAISLTKSKKFCFRSFLWLEEKTGNNAEGTFQSKTERYNFEKASLKKPQKIEFQREIFNSKTTEQSDGYRLVLFNIVDVCKQSGRTQSNSVCLESKQTESVWFDAIKSHKN